MMVNAPEEPGYQVLIPNFERVYPNIKVEATYPPSTTLWYQLESTELAAGNAPDVLGRVPGCGTPSRSVCSRRPATWRRWSRSRGRSGRCRS